jgi:hypothetical protein
MYSTDRSLTYPHIIFKHIHYHQNASNFDLLTPIWTWIPFIPLNSKFGSRKIWAKLWFAAAKMLLAILPGVV